MRSGDSDNGSVVNATNNLVSYAEKLEGVKEVVIPRMVLGLGPTPTGLRVKFGTFSGGITLVVRGNNAAQEIKVFCCHVPKTTLALARKSRDLRYRIWFTKKDKASQNSHVPA
jgi:hypothetical protein